MVSSENQREPGDQATIRIIDSIGGKVVRFKRLDNGRLPVQVWAEIEREWRVGFATVVDIAERYGINPGTVRDKAKVKHWGKLGAELTRTIRTATKASTIESAVREARATAATGKSTAESIAQAEQAATEQSIDQVVADYRAVVSKIISEHRAVASEARGILATAIKEVRDCQTLLKDKYAGNQLARFKLVRAVTETLRVALQAIAKAIELERQAYGMDDRDDSDGMEGYESYLAKSQADAPNEPE